MRRNRYTSALAAITAALALGVAACGGEDEEPAGTNSAASGGEEQQQEELSGTIRIDGSSTVFPYAEAAGELFNEEQPNVQVTVGQSGTGGGFEKFCAGETDISNASRPIKADEEVPVCEKAGVKFEEVTVANDGIAVVTNPGLDDRLPHGRPAQADLGARLEGQEPERGRRRPARHASSASSARARTRARSTSSRIRSTVRKALRARTTRRPRTTTSSWSAWKVPRAASATSASPTTRPEGQAEPRRRRRGRGELQEARRGLDPGRLLHAAVAPALHVPVRQGAGAA